MPEKNTKFLQVEESLDIRKELRRYAGHWPWFVLSVLLCMACGFVYLRYADVVYVTTAKVKIVDDKEAENFSLDISKLGSRSSVNLQNEIAAFTSYRLAEQVVRNLESYTTYLEMGTIKNTSVTDPPFKVQYLDTIANLEHTITFTVALTEKGYDIVQDGKIMKHLNGQREQTFSLQQVPLRIGPTEIEGKALPYTGNYEVRIRPVPNAALDLTNAVQVALDGKDSDILQIQMQSTDRYYAQNVINNLIEVYAQDGVFDRQQVSLRTIAFVDERFAYLGYELDSIEVSKKRFKERNDVSIISSDVQTSIQKRIQEDTGMRNIETQLQLAVFLLENLRGSPEMRLIPADLGLNNAGINLLVSQYNTLFLEYDKMGLSAGKNNPTYKQMGAALAVLLQNIQVSIESYVDQLQASLNQAQFRTDKAQDNFRDIPEKEQILRGIERQQDLKENLYLLLLQKREEAAISLAVTVPNIKVIDYAITDSVPVAPKRKVILVGALGIGLFIPLGVLYLGFVLNTKINSRDDIEKLNLPIPLIGEIPFMEEFAVISDDKDRSVMGEAFRITGSNMDYKLGQRAVNRAKVIFVTSSFKGEGKTFVAVNLALSYAFLNKKVLLIGVDLRNPQIHKYFDMEKGEKGVADYLTNPGLRWQDFLQKGRTKAAAFDLMLSGSPSLNPAMILANDNFDGLIASVVGHYDYVVVDTAPMLLVSDTHMIAGNADATVHVLRAGVTDKSILEYALKLKEEEKLRNMTFVLNAVGKSSTYGYGYGYGYNYGYGYGYGTTSTKPRPWYKRLF